MHILKLVQTVNEILRHVSVHADHLKGF